MPDIASISTAIATVKTAIEITKTISDVDQSLEKSELKLKIVELRESLVNAKNELLDVQELIQEKNAEIKRLQSLIEEKNFSQINDFPADCEKVLVLLSQTTNSMSVADIAMKLQISEQKIDYFLDILKNRQFVYSHSFINRKPEYSLNKNGRKYLVEKELL